MRDVKIDRQIKFLSGQWTTQAGTSTHIVNCSKQGKTCRANTPAQIKKWIEVFEVMS